MNLSLIIPTGPLTILNFVLVGPDHEEEVGPEHPAQDAADGVRDGQADEGLQDVEDVEDQADSSQDDPRLHEADVPLKYKDIGGSNQLRIQT